MEYTDLGIDSSDSDSETKHVSEDGINVLIPMAGIGKRFQDEGYLCPKPLVKVLGTPILDRLLSCLKLGPTDTVFIPHVKCLDTMWMLDILKKYFSIISVYDDLRNLRYVSGYQDEKARCVVIEMALPSRGAAETLLLATKFMDNKTPLLSLDCDNVYSQSPCDLIRNVGVSAVFYFKDTQKNPIYSYISMDSDERVLRIREKEKISDYACSGGYYFATTSLAIRYATKLLHSLVETELYISGIYTSMIAHGECVRGIEAVPDSFGIPIAVETYTKKNVEIIGDPKIFCFDLDSTILTPPIINKNYQSCQPIWKVIKFIRYIFSFGHTVIIYTARGMLSIKNAADAEQAHRQCITDMLEKYEVPYHQLIFGKPYADFYIDDKAVSTFSNLGRETGFYPDENPPNMSHQLVIQDTNYVKTGNLEGEYWWYTHIPAPISDLFPTMLPESTPNRIVTTRIPGLTYTAKFLSGTLTILHLQALLHSLERIHNCQSPACEDIYKNYIPKLDSRIEDKEDLLYKEIRIGLEKYRGKGKAGVIHGDPVFTNVFVTETNTVMFIDMRGKQDQELTIYGDRMYDMAKVYQSLTGYDAILHESNMPSNMGDLIGYFEKCMGNVNMKWIYLLTASLYLTLIPLHLNENRYQRLQYRNMAIRLMSKYHLSP